MRTFITLVDRNRKLFFRDKGMLLSSLITPIILIVLYATFLAKVYKDSFTSNIPAAVDISEKLNGTDSPRDYWNEYYELKCLVERLCATIHKSYDDFPQYVEWREQKARENNS